MQVILHPHIVALTLNLCFIYRLIKAGAKLLLHETIIANFIMFIYQILIQLIFKLDKLNNTPIHIDRKKKSGEHYKKNIVESPWEKKWVDSCLKFSKEHC